LLLAFDGGKGGAGCLGLSARIHQH